MKHLKLFENFESDVESICKKYNIRNWKVNSDGLVDVDGDVIFPLLLWDNIHSQTISKALNRLEKLPLKFGNVSGNFVCHNQKLTTLEGSPIYVGGDFRCQNNKLTTLEGGPSRVGGNYWCGNNKLITLEGGPKEVHYFNCAYNPINKIYTWFPNYKSFIDSMDYSYLRGKTIDKLRFQEALDEIGIKLPESIPGYKYI